MVFELDKVIDTLNKGKIKEDTLYWCSDTLMGLVRQVKGNADTKSTVSVRCSLQYPFETGNERVFAYAYPAGKVNGIIRAGDTVRIADRGKIYSTYIKFLAGKEVHDMAFSVYKLWQYARSPNSVDCTREYKVMAVKKHEDYPERKIAVISDMTTRTFIIDVKGLELV